MAPFVGGSILIVVGVLCIVFRVAVARWNRRLLRRQWGRSADDALRNSTPTRTAVVGVGAILIGAWLMMVRPGG